MMYLRLFLITITAILAAALFAEMIDDWNRWATREALKGLAAATILFANLYYLITQQPESYYGRSPGRIGGYFSNWLTAKESDLEQRFNKATSQG